MAAAEANQARTHTADSETKQFLFQPPLLELSRLRFSASFLLPFNLPRSPLPALTPRFLCVSSFSGNRGIRQNSSGPGREKGSFPRDNDRRVLRKEHPSRSRCGGERARSGGKEDKRERSREDVRRQKPANRQESETIAISAFVRGVQSKGKRANVKRQPAARKAARENA